jgi:hypothetical protein
VLTVRKQLNSHLTYYLVVYVGIQNFIGDLSGLVSSFPSPYLYHLCQVCLTHTVFIEGTPRLTEYGSIYRLTSGLGGLKTRLYWLTDWLTDSPPVVTLLWNFSSAVLYPEGLMQQAPVKLSCIGSKLQGVISQDATDVTACSLTSYNLHKVTQFK